MARRSSAPAHASLLTYASAHAARSRAAQRIKPACSPLSKHWTIFFLPDEQTHFLCLLILALLEIMPPQQHCSVLPTWAAWSLSSSHAPLKSHIHIPIACNLQKACIVASDFLKLKCFSFLKIVPIRSFEGFNGPKKDVDIGTVIQNFDLCST